MTSSVNSSPATTSIVTGAFGFSGQKIAKRLLLRGETVRTLTIRYRCFRLILAIPTS
jgi:short subunit dehydrogenase-like uncharacterized protein